MKEILKQLNNEIKNKSKNTRLMSVSKTHPIEAVNQAYELGERLFGENRVQEVQSKFPPKNQRPSDMELHLIGHLQSNKSKKAVELFDSIDSVDSIKLIKKLDNYAKELNKTIDIMLEYNSSKDANKTGFESYEDIKAAAKLTIELENVNLIGIMTIGPLYGDREDIRNAFKLVKTIKDDLEKDLSYDIQELSMGMSGDYDIAIEEGSTIIRVGTKIFGNRDYSKKG